MEVGVGKENGPKTRSNVKHPKKRLTVVQRWLTQGEKSDEKCNPSYGQNGELVRPRVLVRGNNLLF